MPRLLKLGQDPQSCAPRHSAPIFHTFWGVTKIFNTSAHFFLQLVGKFGEIFIFDFRKFSHHFGGSRTFLINDRNLFSHAEGDSQFEENLLLFGRRKVINSKPGTPDLTYPVIKGFPFPGGVTATNGCQSASLKSEFNSPSHLRICNSRRDEIFTLEEDLHCFWSGLDFLKEGSIQSQFFDG